MVSLTQIAFLALAFALGTQGFGWISVPLLAAAWGAIAYQRPHAAFHAGLGAATGCAALLVGDGFSGPFGKLAGLLSTVMHLPTVGLISITLLLPALLAWSTTTVLQWITQRALPQH